MPRVLTLLLVVFFLSSPIEAAERCAGYALTGAPLKTAPFGIVADVNGDGIPDVVSGGSVTFGGTNAVVKLPRTASTGPVAAVARVSRKGPVALLRLSGNSLESLRVSPDGTTTVSSTPLSGSTTILGVGDFNEDGIDDVILRQQIRFGSANGTFTSGPALPLAIPEGLEVNGISVDVGVGDFDGDHHLDLAMRPRFSYSTSPPWVYPPLTIYSGDGKGNFHATRQVPNRQFDEIIMPIYVADLDGDGVDDLILDAWYGIDLVPSHPGTARQAVADSGVYIDSITVGDFNGDGRPDFAAFAQSSNVGDAQIDLRVFLNDGHGGMRLAWKTRLRYAQMSARDVDGDGKDDLVLGPYYPPGNFIIENESMAAVLHSNGDGSFSGLPVIDAPQSYGGVQGDFDGNGADDVMLSTWVRISNTQIDYKTTIFWNEGNGSFHTTTTTQQLFGGELAADVDGDGRAEILRPSGKNEVSVYKVAPDGVLQGASRIAGDPQGSMLGYAVGHFTSRNQEIALVEKTSVSSQLKVEIFDARSPLVPRLSATVTATLPASLAFDVAASDLNGDGRDDLIILGEGIIDCLHCYSPTANGYVMALLSTSTSFSPAVMLYQSAGALFKPIAGDFDGDRIGDFAFTEGYNGVNPGTNVLFGDRAGHYRQTNLSYASLLAVTDLDGNGADDLLTSDGSTISLLFGGLTPFARRQSYAATGSTAGLFTPRPHPGGVPQLFVPSDYPGGLLFNPTCEKSRAARH